MRHALKMALLCVTFALAACSSGGLGASKDSPYAPTGVGRGQAVDGLIVGDRLMEAAQYELALDAYIRAAGQYGMTADVLSSLGSANLALGRLGQAEKQFRDSLNEDENRADTWNNLGVVLMERDEYAEAEQIFRKAFALDNGQSDSIRDNLRLALAKSKNPAYDDGQNQEYKLVRRGGSDYLLSKTP
ncbi:tetratricopeptide repeat protein [Shimia thalassica]|uniref:tetratricopeptide repeat protein n=1 Tax=Shimia thalassica TaxID=1715693 RepID=UPI002734ACD2|nr:tetratricopeptide repeat protein [Shimia thalassica]MDP2581624.1 tetratricopeptide repeat protein [Shimia thalassica]